MSWISGIAEGVLGVIKEPVIEWQKRKTLEVKQRDRELDRDHEARMKKIDVATELAKQGIQVEADWDARAQEGMKHSWKDEWFTILFSLPLVGAFVPSWQSIILDGFNTLQQTPEWYIMLVTGIVAATFGLRWLISRRRG
jgi:hypothetical protein